MDHNCRKFGGIWHEMMDAFRKKEADEKRAGGVEHCWISWRGWRSVKKRVNRKCKEKETAEKMGKWAVDRLGETRRRAGVSDKDGGAPDDKHKKSGEIVEVLKESIKATKKKEEAERELRERDKNL